MTHRITRRGLLAGTAAVFALGVGHAPADEGPVDILWEDLVPGGGNALGDALNDTLGDLLDHETAQALGLMDQQTYGEVTTAYDGTRVRLPGYMVPIAYDGVGVTEFLLVPYVGACIHVPPPPPNQIVMVTAETPYPVSGYFEPIYVTGVMQTEALTTDLAEVGYFIPDAEIAPYE